MGVGPWRAVAVVACVCAAIAAALWIGPGPPAASALLSLRDRRLCLVLGRDLCRDLRRDLRRDLSDLRRDLLRHLWDGVLRAVLLADEANEAKDDRDADLRVGEVDDPRVGGRSDAGDDLHDDRPTELYKDLPTGLWAGAVSDADVAICTVVRDEAAWLDEWVVFHAWQGVGHLYIYDDGSTDDVKRVLRPYESAGLVSRVRWPQAAGEGESNRGEHLCDSEYYRAHPGELNRCQLAAFDHCLETYGPRHTWILFIDVDEFAFATENETETVASVLADPAFASVHSVALVAALYGSSGRVWTPPLGTPVTAAFQWRSAAAYDRLPVAARVQTSREAFLEETFKLKSAVRTAAGARSGRCGAHLFASLGDDPKAIAAVATDGAPIRGCGFPERDPAHCLLRGCTVGAAHWHRLRYNHYKVRAWEDYHAKLHKEIRIDGRGTAPGVVQGALANKQHSSGWKTADRNDVWDPVAVSMIAHRARRWVDCISAARRTDQEAACAPAGVRPHTHLGQLWRSLANLSAPLVPPAPRARLVLVVGVDPEATQAVAGALGLAGAYVNGTGRPACDVTQPWQWCVHRPGRLGSLRREAPDATRSVAAHAGAFGCASQPLQFPTASWPQAEVRALHTAWRAGSDGAVDGGQLRAIADGLRGAAVPAPVRLLYDPALCGALPRWLAAVPDAHLVVAVSDPAEGAARAAAWRPGTGAAERATQAWLQCMLHVATACASHHGCTLVGIPRRGPDAPAAMASQLGRMIARVATALADGPSPVPLDVLRSQLLGPTPFAPDRPLHMPPGPRLRALAETLGRASYEPVVAAASSARTASAANGAAETAASTLYHQLRAYL